MFFISRLLPFRAERDGEEEAVSLSLFEAKDCKGIIIRRKPKKLKEHSFENVYTVCKRANWRIKRSISSHILDCSIKLLVINRYVDGTDYALFSPV